MGLPYFPMYPSDFEAKTSHLTLAEDGAYNRLLRIMWMTPGCTIPDDSKWIMRRLRCDKDTFESVVLIVIDEFFTSKNGRLSNAKLSRIYADTNEAHKKRVSAGSKGGKAKALQSNDKPPSNGVAKLKQPEPEPEPYIDDDDTREDISTDREQVLEAMGHDKSGVTATGRIIGNPADMLEFKRWIDLGLSMREILVIVSNVSKQKNGDPPISFKYFTSAMQKFAGDKLQPALEPKFGGTNGNGINNSNGYTRGDAAYDEARERAFRIGHAEKAPEPDLF